MTPNLKITLQNTIHVFFKVASVNNDHKCAMNAQKLAKIHLIHEDNGYHFLASLNIESWEDNGVFFIDHDLYVVYQPHSDPVVIPTYIDKWRIETIFVE